MNAIIVCNNAVAFNIQTEYMPLKSCKQSLAKVKMHFENAKVIKRCFSFVYIVILNKYTFNNYL